ncbi:MULTISPECIES: NADH:flavin oxidoreductase/NADH oxidase [unclassified Acinetobacter]|uniref:NADH:flavin oxidoreductase/NADH oxidase n=2 Tax=unclassified Acinetobacter TaxID=196816 RepID=UPI0011FBB003|nr:MULTISPECIES: NADH:flavin oxidoreductase/NADH oxidase [unclassified Acinetobacter]RZJ21350.1 MAG: NADH:flavin oxidoreductase/NADH oxidase [Acinetobacter sp.]
MALLFQPIQFGSLKLNNKIVIAPMCQYSATEQGEVTYWHEQQWANYALSGAGMCIIEATAVQPEGRISYADLGLWNDLQRAQMKALLAKVKSLSPMPVAIQLAHAGRKASTDKPWDGKGQFKPDEAQGWQTVSASDLPFNPTDHPPHALSKDEIQKVIQDFADAAVRAVDAGFDLIEVHAAHGYLLHQFMSPLSNKRTDEYGGSFENRIRLTLEVLQAIKNAVPADYPVGVRISATDWMDGKDSWDIESSVGLSKALQQLGAVYIHVSSGGLHAQQQIEIGVNYQVPFAHAIKQAVNIPVIAVGLITEATQAEHILQTGQADAIGLARAMLYDPRWPWHAAATLDAPIEISPQYLRCQPHGLKSLFKPFQHQN